MQKVGKLKTLKGKCPNCENKFIATTDDFIMTENIQYKTLLPMVQCPYCKTYIYKSSGFFGETIWEEPHWEFKIKSCDKANEWRYHGIPHDNRPYLCKVEQPTKYDESEYEILFFDDKEMSWFRWLTLWSGEEGNECARINRKVIAWKEIVPPKLPKESEK